MSPRVRLTRAARPAFALASILFIAGAACPARAQFPFISAYPACAPDSSYVVWSVFDPSHSNPEWVGFDVYRRALPGCEAVRMNPEIIPRLPDPGYSIGFGEIAASQTIGYEVRAVDASRQQLFFPGFCSPCVAYANCPPFTSPITVGTLQELAPNFVYVIPCPGSCYPSPYFAGGVPPDLQPYVGTSAAVAIFALVTCGGVEGCSMSNIDHWQLASCVTGSVPASWGRLKTIYR